MTRPANAVLVVFVQEGCHACAEYKPVVDKVAAKYTGRVPVLIYDANDERKEVQALADRLGVSATPATYVMRRGPSSPVGAEDALAEGALEYLFQLAHHYV